MRKAAAPLTPTLALLVIATAGTLLVDLGNANPNPFQTFAIYAGEVPPPKNAKQPSILLLSPKNNSYLSSNNVSVDINVSLNNSPLQYSTVYGFDEYTTVHIYPHLDEVYYRTDWQPTNTHAEIAKTETGVESNQTIISLNLTQIPEGNHNITFCATEWSPNQVLNVSQYGLGKLMYYDGFFTSSYSTISFIIDTAAPIVSFLSLENMTYTDSKAPLNFTVNEQHSQLSYALDSQDNMIISGNITLSGLAVGSHNLTVYAKDLAGNIGASETVTFIMAEPTSFPTVPVVAVSAVSIAAIGVAAGLILARRRRRKEAQQT